MILVCGKVLNAVRIACRGTGFVRFMSAKPPAIPGVMIVHDVFYIAAIIAVSGNYAGTPVVTYHVITNAGTSIYTPALGDKLPGLVIDFMSNHDAYILPGVSPTVAVFNSLLVRGRGDG